MAIQPHRLDNASDKLNAFFLLPCAAHSVATLEKEVKQTGISLQQQYYIHNLLDQYYNRVLSSAGALFSYVTYKILTIPPENRTDLHGLLLVADAACLAVSVFLKYQNLHAMTPLKAQMAQRA